MSTVSMIAVLVWLLLMLLLVIADNWKQRSDEFYKRLEQVTKIRS